MGIDNHTIRNDLKIIWAIAFKDIGEAFKNRTILFVLLGVGLFLVIGQLPMLLRADELPSAIIYDAGQTGLVDELLASTDVNAASAPSQQAMKTVLMDGGNQLGLMIPESFNQQLETTSVIDLNGYFAYTTRQSNRIETVELFEQKLTELTGHTIHIDFEGNTVYATPETVGPSFMVALLLVVCLTTTSVSIVPYLIIEEKQTRTLDALLVFPLSISHVVVGKALAGLIYGMSVAVLILSINHVVVVHWGLAIIATIIATVFAVSLGLLMGALFENVQGMILWAGMVTIALLVPVFMSTAPGLGWPELIRRGIPWLPTVALTRVLQSAFSGTFSVGHVLLDASVVLGYSLLLLGLVAWKIQRSDR